MLTVTDHDGPLGKPAVLFGIRCTACGREVIIEQGQSPRPQSGLFNLQWCCTNLITERDLCYQTS